jgi:transcriptional regulator with XRE-family HTH domain
MFKSLILSELKKQKEALSIPYEAIATRSGLGIATVKRAFSGHDISLDTLDKIAVALGCEIAIKPKQSAKALYQAQIEKKAYERESSDPNICIGKSIAAKRSTN